MPKPLPVKTAFLMPAEPFLKFENCVNMMLTLFALERGMTFTTSDFFDLLPADVLAHQLLHVSVWVLQILDLRALV